MNDLKSVDSDFEFSEWIAQEREQAMGVIVAMLGGVIGFIGGLWGLIVCLGIVSTKLGTLAAIVAFFLFPATLIFAPWYVGFADSNWFPVLLIYGSGVIAALLRGLGMAIESRQR